MHDLTPSSRLPAPFRLHRDLLGALEADGALVALLGETPWEERHIRIFGRSVPMPRRLCWYGPLPYAYSGIEHPARPLPPLVEQLRRRVEDATGLRFNAVLLNLYRDGRDSMGLHADDDYDHGGQDAVASLSLGATRRLRLVERAPGGRRLAVDLPHDSLLLMGPGAQRDWRHALPRTARPCGPRVNLTFRHHLGPREAPLR